MLKQRNLLFALFLMTCLGALGQQMPVHFSVHQKQVNPGEVDVVFTAKIDNGWHVYSTGLPADGPTSATLHTEKAEGAELMGKLVARGKELNVQDNIFGMKLR